MKAGSRLEKLFKRGVFVVTSELGPPKSVDSAVLDSKVVALKGAVDAVNITDNQSAIVRVSSIGAGIYVRNAGIEPIIQMTCRDRNRLAIQADLLGASLNGMKNLLCITGDHQGLGNHPAARAVFDIDSIQLIGIVRDMREKGVFQCGEAIRNGKNADVRAPRFLVGGAANPFAEPVEWRVDRLQKKVNAGVDFIQTQCIFDMEQFSRWMKEITARGLHKKVKICAGVSPLKSPRMAMYMKKKIAGVVIPDHIIRRISKAEDAKAEGLRICIEQIQQLQEMEGVAGVHIMAVEWETAVRGIVEDAGLLPRPEMEE